MRIRPVKKRIIIYMEPRDLEYIHDCVEKYWVNNVGDFVRHAIRHYKPIIENLYGGMTG